MKQSVVNYLTMCNDPQAISDHNTIKSSLGRLQEKKPIVIKKRTSP